jgi:hypothetical protein
MGSSSERDKTEEQLNQAKIKLVQAEDRHEAQKAEYDRAVVHLAEDSARLQDMQRRRAIASMVGFVQEEVQMTRASLRLWEELRRSLLDS